MIGTETTRGAFNDVMRKSYDQYAMAAQFRNAVIREQLQAMQDFVEISDKLLRLPFPGLMATDRSNEDYKALAIQMQNVFTEHSNNALEIWASMFGRQGRAASEAREVDSPKVDRPAKKKAASPAAGKEPKTNGKQASAEVTEAAPA